MENMELDNIPLQENLSKSAKWAKYLAYITFISVGLSFLQLVLGIIANKGSIALSIFVFIISTVITLILAVCLFYFSKYTEIGLRNGDNLYFTQALHNLKIYFIVIGVIFLIVLSLIALFILVLTISSIVK